MQDLVSSLGKQVSGLKLLKYNCSKLYFSNFRPLTVFRVTIPDAVLIQFYFLMMSMTLLETCRGQ